MFESQIFKRAQHTLSVQWLTEKARGNLGSSSERFSVALRLRDKSNLSGTISCCLKGDTVSSRRFSGGKFIEQHELNRCLTAACGGKISRRAWMFKATREQWATSSLRFHNSSFVISPRSPAKRFLLPASERPCTIFRKKENKSIQAGNVMKPRDWHPRVEETWTLWMKKWLQDCATHLNLTNFMYSLIWDSVLTLWIECERYNTYISAQWTQWNLVDFHYTWRMFAL